MINSIHNPRIKYVVSLQTKPRFRREEKKYIVEGPKMVSEIPFEECTDIFVAESYINHAQKILKGAPFEVVSEQVFAMMSDTQTPQGILAVVRQKEYTMDSLLQGVGGNAPLLLILENIQDPGNLGTILRAGEGAGVSGVLMNRGTVDIFNSKVIRSTMGAMFRVPFLYSDDLTKDINDLKNRGIRTYAACLGANSSSYDSCDYSTPTAFLIGNESQGLTEETALLADQKVIIPMLGRVESLNAAVASSILVFEAARQRRNK